MSKTVKKPPVKSGPPPAVLKIEGDWKDAIKASLSKKKPADGWSADGWSKEK
jgi:hypothetical protein